MITPDRISADSIPALYDRCLGPLLFEPYARDLAARVAALAPARVLETACGTGIVTRRLREQLPASTSLTATDLSESMLAVARAALGPLGDGVTWRPADMCALPFDDGAFDAVVCQFGLMFAPDKLAAARAARRVLRPGGAYLFSVWDALEHNRIVQVAHETITGFYPDDTPPFFTTPFGHHDAHAIRLLLRDAGFADCTIETVALVGESPSAREAAEGLVRGTPVVAAIRERGTVPEAVIVAAVAEALALQIGRTPVHASLRALVVRATAR